MRQRTVVALALVAALLGSQLAFPSATSAQQPRVDCDNYLEVFERTSVEARHIASVCGDDLEPPEQATPAPSPSPVPGDDPRSGSTAPGGSADLDAAFAALEGEIQERVDAYEVPGEYAIAVTDLQTGEAISIHGDRLQLAGCSINIFAVLQATLDAQRGVYPESRVGELIQTTVHFSSATHARDLYRIAGNGDTLAGVREARELVGALGLTRTVLDHAPGYYASGSLANRNNYMTAREANSALAQLWAGEVLTPEWRDYLLAKMGNIKPGLNYLTAYGIGGVSSHKNGFFPAASGDWWVDNDIGIVQFERGGQTYAYAISFFSQRVPVKYGSLSLFQPISELVWAYFDAKYS